MSLTYEPNPDWVKINHLAEYLRQRSFRWKVIVRSSNTYTHTHSGPIALPGPLKRQRHTIGASGTVGWTADDLERTLRLGQ